MKPLLACFAIVAQTYIKQKLTDKQCKMNVLFIIIMATILLRVFKNLFQLLITASTYQ